MKRILTITLATMALILLTACGGKKSTEDLLVGNWETAEAMERTEGPVTIKISDMSTNFKKNKTSESSGKMSMAGAMFPSEIGMDVKTSGTWSLEGMVLTQTITEADVKMTSEIPGMPDMGGMMADGMKAAGATTSTIISIDGKKLVVKDDNTGEEMTLVRK